MLEVGNVIDLKCKKIVSALFESKMLKLESEIKENHNESNKDTKKVTTQNLMSQNALKQ